jgi:hypothetical protein
MAGLGFLESVKMILTLIQIRMVRDLLTLRSFLIIIRNEPAFFLIYISLFGRWSSKRANGRPLNRVLHDEAAYFVLSHLSVRQLQAVSGSSLAGYAKWAKRRKISQVIDELSDSDTRIMWVGPRETDHVVIYCHGPFFPFISVSFIFF